MKKRKRAGCGIGADRAPGRFWRENGECRVYGRGAPRRKSVGLLAADGEWDARNKLFIFVYGRIVSKKSR